MKIETMAVNPEIARKLLESNTKNRPVSFQAASRLADAMRSGAWIANGDTIAFAEDGTLLDGQHRLYAVIEAGVSVEMLVVRGLSPEAFATKDIGKKRTIGDILHVRGERNTNLLGSAASMCICIEAEYTGKRMPAHSGHKVQPSTIIDYIDAHPYLRECTNLPERYIGRPSISMAINSLSHDIGIDARPFIESVHTGIGLAANAPAYILRETLLKMKGSQKSTVSRRWETAAWIRAFNAHLAGRPMTFVRFNDSEEFPMIAHFRK